MSLLMPEKGTCSDCGAPVPGGELGSLCAACILKMALTPDPSKEQNLPEHPFPRYFADHEIIDEIARGGMGVVYRARRLGIGRPVALKVVRSGSLATPDARLRFAMEIEAISRLNHRHIITLFETGEQEDQHYFSMPLYPGGSLADHLVTRASLPDLPEMRRQVFLLAKIASAVHYAHSRGILHRDIKPSNILLDDQGEPVLTDFGLVKHLGQDSDVTVSRTVVGSPRYMAPEQAAKEDLSTAADIYGLGAVLHEMLTGEPPAENEFHPSPRRKNPSIPRDLAAICLHCLELEPARRYPSASALESDLQRWSSGEPVTCHRRSPLAMAWLWCRRKPALASLLASCCFLLLSLIIGGSVAFLRISKAERVATARLHSLQVQQVETLFASHHTAESIALLASVVRKNPSDKFTSLHLLSELGHRSYPVPLGRPLQHHSKIAACAWNNALVTLSCDGSITRWNSETNTFQTIDTIPNDGIRQAIISPDGKSALMIMEDHSLKFWRHGQAVQKFLGLTKLEQVISWAISPDWTRLAIATRGGGLIIWSIPEKQLLHTNHSSHGTISAMAFSQDGAQLATGSNRGELQIWKMGDFSIHPLLRGSYRHFTALEFSPDGSRLATGDQTGVIRIYFTKNGAPETRFFQHGNIIHDFAFDPEGQLLASGSDESTVRIWNMINGRASCEPAPTTHGVRSVSFLRHGSKLQVAAVTRDHTLSVFIVRRPYFSRTEQDFGDEVPLTFGYQYRPNSLYARKLPATSPEGTRMRAFVRPPGKPWRAAFNHCGTRLVTTNARGITQIWETTNRTVLHTLDFCDNLPSHLVFSPDDRTLAIATRKGRVTFWDPVTAEKNAPDLLTSRYTRDLVFTPDSRQYLVTRNRRISLVDLATGEAHWERQFEDKVYSARFSPDTSSIIAACADGSAYLWNINDHQKPLRFPHGERLFHATFSPDGKLVLTASTWGSFRLWDAETTRPITTRIPVRQIITGAGFSKDGNRIITTTNNGKYQVWEFPKAVEIPDLPRLAEAVTGFRSQPDGQIEKMDLLENITLRETILSHAPSSLARWLLEPKD